ncbi:outer membrane usher protein lpfC [Enterobacter cancerogenus]|uniref:Outer membrane usher protein lpfC n=1 Tax=Enterobacter cancerogenus TaxID=69218 RepID=A0A484WXA0_9ENTR|nr:outer membrane usher protein lpfC [Enterobacter cancerogenus]
MVIYTSTPGRPFRLPSVYRLLTLLTLICGLAVIGFRKKPAGSNDYFNPALLDVDNPTAGKTDLSIYEKGPGQAPGKYQVAIYINNNKIDTRRRHFYAAKSGVGRDFASALF